MGLGRFEVVAGDFKAGKDSQYVRGKFLMKAEGKVIREKIPLADLEALEPATEESVVRIGGAAGWGVAGGVLLGPAGLLAGLLLGGKGKKTTFVCRFNDGRKFIGTAPTKLYNEIQRQLMARSF